MSVCKVLKTSSAHALAGYLVGKEGNRAAHYMSNAGSPRGWANQARQVAEIYGREIEAQHIIVSFSKDDVDPANPQQRDDAMMAVWDLLNKVAPASEKLALAHDDADGGHFHVHAAITNHDQETGHRLRGASTHWQIKPVHDEVMKKHGFSVPEPGVTWADKRPSVARRKDDPTFTVALGDKISEVLEQSEATDFESFRQELAEEGVTVTAQAKNGVSALTYKMYNEGKGRETRRSASKLAKEFCWDGLQENFKLNREIAAEMEQQHDLDSGEEAQAFGGAEEAPRPGGAGRAAEEQPVTGAGGDGDAAGRAAAAQHAEIADAAERQRQRERDAKRTREEEEEQRHRQPASPAEQPAARQPDAPAARQPASPAEQPQANPRGARRGASSIPSAAGGGAEGNGPEAADSRGEGSGDAASVRHGESEAAEARGGSAPVRQRLLEEGEVLTSEKKKPTFRPMVRNKQKTRDHGFQPGM